MNTKYHIDDEVICMISKNRFGFWGNPIFDVITEGTLLIIEKIIITKNETSYYCYDKISDLTCEFYENEIEPVIKTLKRK